MVYHEVTVTFDEKGQLVLTSGFPVTLNAQIHASAGDKIRWTSPHGKVRIRFRDGNPFGAVRMATLSGLWGIWMAMATMN